MSCVLSTYLYGAFDCMLLSCHVWVSRVNPYSVVWLNVKKLLVQSSRHIWSLSGSNEIRTHNYLVCKQTLNYLVKLAKWLSCVVSTYLYGAFDCKLLSCHIQVFRVNSHSERIRRILAIGGLGRISALDVSPISEGIS